MLNIYDKERIKEISEIIKSEGYEIGNFEGVKLNNITESCIGILCTAKIKIMKFRIPTNSVYIANLWLNPDYSLEDYSTKWALNIYGRENYDKLDNILMKLRNKYFVKITKNLETENVEEEFDGGLLL